MTIAASVPIVGGAMAAAALATRYLVGRASVDRVCLGAVDSALDSIGEVDQFTILPLVERLISSADLQGEPGVAYLLKADNTTLLFDAGLNRARRSPLEHNARILDANLGTLDGIVLSHLHADHVGGLRSAGRRTFAISTELVEQRGLPAFVPTPMRHDRADVVLTEGPRVIAPGVALLPPLPHMMFWLGRLAEQALVVNVRGFGLALVSGCGHPGVERMLAAAERVLDVPVSAVVGGLHLPVHALGTPLLLQATLGNPNWPWRPLGERDVAAAISELQARGPRLIALSSHDSTPWTYDAFAQVFGDRYRTLRVGESFSMSAPGAAPSEDSTIPAP
jgi:7,8-dihydropterin-6-yl-methyl-4-(beta-D-ribofuranosyl)aminobenzene 5'-phosphate synthase